jgi:hypothetical protein
LFAEKGYHGIITFRQIYFEDAFTYIIQTHTPFKKAKQFTILLLDFNTQDDSTLIKMAVQSWIQYLPILPYKNVEMN